MSKCYKCGADIDSDSLFCDQCGAEQYVCPKCHIIGKGPNKRCGCAARRLCLQQDSKATTARNNKGQRSLLRGQHSNKGRHSLLLEQRSNKERRNLLRGRRSNKGQRNLLLKQRNNKERRSNKEQHAWRAIWCARQSRCRYLL